MKLVTQISTLLLLCFGVGVYGQTFKQGSIWYMPRYGFDFKYSPPKTLYDSKIYWGGERTSCITDENGNLLFYTNTDTVWNKNHEVMQNGTHLNPYESANPVTPVIVPHPGDGQLYYIFISNRGSDNNLPPSAFIYCLVDISGSGGKGTVIQKNVKLFDHSTQLLTVGGHADEKSFWVITHGYGNNKFYAYHISEAGIGPPVISSIGSIADYDTRQLKISPDGTKIAMPVHAAPELYDFNSKTGIVSNHRVLGTSSIGATGVEFSPNSELLYCGTGWGTIIQFDISSENITSIINSKIEVGKWKYDAGFADLQLAYNGKIYAGFYFGGVSNRLVSIEAPNNKGLDCQYSNEGLLLPSGIIYSHLPLSVQSYYRSSPAIVALPACTNVPTQLHITGMGYADSLTWDFGDGEVRNYSSSNGKIVSHIFNAPGMYPVKVKKYIGNIYREIVSAISVIDRPEVNLGTDTILCVGENILLDGGSQGTTYIWSTGANTRTIRIREAGTYQVEVNNGICTTMDEITINVNEYPEISLGDDKIICDKDSIELSVDQNTDYIYQWSTGSQTNSIAVSESGDYGITLSHGRCSSSDQVHVQFAPVKNLQLSNTAISTSYGNDIYLEAQGMNIDTWRWVFGDGLEETTNASSIAHSYEKAGQYRGQLLASNSYGCTDEAFFEVNVPYHLFIPNVFTPNNDGKNDTFEVQYNGAEDFRVEIYNRWGETIFSSDTLEKRWSGLGMSSGTYYYKVKTGKISHKGWVAVLK